MNRLRVSGNSRRETGSSGSRKRPLTCFRAESKNVGRTLLSVDRGLTDRSVRPT